MRFLRVQELWRESGLSSTWARYERLSRGAARRGNGKALEDLAAVAAALAAEALGLEADGYLQGCEWREGKKLRGEVDVVVLKGSQVLAMVEMKSGWFELPVALLEQHEQKCARALRGELSLYWTLGGGEIEGTWERSR